MMRLELVVQWLGGILAYAALGLMLYGIWRGTRREAGRSTGKTAHLLWAWWFYAVSTLLFFSISYFGWKPLKLTIPSEIRSWMVIAGALLYFPGMIFVIWARVALGRNYFVSTGFGAQLFASHQLVTSGPFAIVRHPMYAGLILASIGALLIYFTWTTLYFAVFAPLLLFRAIREEQVLLAEFGDEWTEYCRRVPLLVPHWRRKRMDYEYRKNSSLP